MAAGAIPRFSSGLGVRYRKLRTLRVRASSPSENIAADCREASRPAHPNQQRRKRFNSWGCWWEMEDARWSRFPGPPAAREFRFAKLLSSGRDFSPHPPNRKPQEHVGSWVFLLGEEDSNPH